MTQNISKFETGETIIVKRGSKAIEAGTEVKVLARDGASGKYAVITSDNKVFTLAAERLAPKPERTFTESEVRAALDRVSSRIDFRQYSGVAALDAVVENLNLDA